jgi:hypothetical protein
MNQTVYLVMGLVVGYFFVKKYLFNPPKKNTRKGFRRKYEARKKEKLNARDESLHQNR